MGRRNRQRFYVRGAQPRRRNGSAAQGQGMAGKAIRQRFWLDNWANRIRRRRAFECPRARVQPSRTRVSHCPTRRLPNWPWHGCPNNFGPCLRRRERKIHPCHVACRHCWLPIVLRARRGQRLGIGTSKSRTRRRRVAHHRTKGVDIGRSVFRHRRNHLPHRPIAAKT